MDLIKGTSRQNPLYVRNCWYVAAWSHELPLGQLFRIVIAGQPVLLYRKGDGTLVALADQCCHRHAPLSRGRLEGDAVRCMYHGLKFNAEGRCIEIPGQDEIPAQFSVRTYAVTEQGGWIWVWLGEADGSEFQLLPQATGPDDPRWVMKAGHIDYAANYLLLNDNLTDFSHISFVHENSFAGGSKATAVLQPRVQMLERGIRVTRWNKNMPAREHRTGGAGIDQFMSYDYLVPGVLLMWTATFPAGTAEACELGHPGEREPLSATFTSQAVTPMTDRSSRYFFCWGPRASDQAANPQLLDAMWRVANTAFEEDRQIIEAQQRNVELRTGAPLASITHDRGPNMMRRVIERLIAAES